MLARFQLLVIALLVAGYASAQSITVQPYLQDASPNSIHILWETDSGVESWVHWGLTDALGNETEGTSVSIDGGTETLHTVHLQGLERFTVYHYQVETAGTLSPIYTFKTPPFASDHESFRIAAMSDMQQDGAFPNKFQEVVEDGIMDYLSDHVGGDLVDNLALVMIPGDLVTNGDNFNSWKNTFFNPGEALFSQVPVYPVLGNHEYNTSFYFTYFHLPENGTPDYLEHWRHKDYGNVRMVGLNSNGPFDGPEQLAWLQEVLDETCVADSIDFVFAQLHHPHKSELWTPGESDFTGEVIEALEQFSTICGKPSIHFFGHTHGYSRGQSRDHKHLWINAATAGGAIDNWGEFPNFDYDEFSVSQDEYGFMLVEILADPDPYLVVKRISRGDQDVVWDNPVTDSLVVRLAPETVQTPTPISPVNITLPPECVVLESEAFSGSTGAQHGQSHWQVATLNDGFDAPVFDAWKNFENWYFDIDTQAGDDLTDETVPGLEPNTDYLWRVRYRDRELNWSDWSEETLFSTGASIALPNLTLNPGAELDTDNWTVLEGIVESLTDGECAGVTPYQGNRYLAVGGLCEESAVGLAQQALDITSMADSVDTGNFPVTYGAHLSNYSGSDQPEMWLEFDDENGTQIGETSVLTTFNSTWTLLSGTLNIPVGTRTIRILLRGTRNAGSDNDSYFDEIYLRLGTDEGCNTTFIPVYASPKERTLLFSPNPATEFVQLQGSIVPGSAVRVLDASGRKVQATLIESAAGVSLDLSAWPAGTYTVWVHSPSGTVSSGQVVKQP